MGRKKDNIGDWFEDQLQQLFKELQSEHGWFWHKFTDSKQARTIVKNQPSDFMVKAPLSKGTWLLEAKASEVHNSLRSSLSMVRAVQISQARRWQEAGNPASFWFYSEPRNMVEYWKADKVILANASGKPLPKEPDLIVPWTGLKDALLEVIHDR